MDRGPWLLSPCPFGVNTAQPIPNPVYYTTAEAGILAWKERVELLDGHIWRMAPLGDRHENVRDTLIGILGDQRKSRYATRANGPIRIPDFSEPHPDLTLYPPGVRKHPPPEGIHLVIEISETSSSGNCRRSRRVPLPEHESRTNSFRIIGGFISDPG